MRSMRRNRVAAALLAIAAAGALVVGATGAATKATVSASSNAGLGKILVGATGLTLYHYAGDHGKTITCSGACDADWPPVLIVKKAVPIAGPGIAKSKLGTVKRPDGRIQVTYNGYALYRFAGDRKPGQSNGQGLLKQWYAVGATGALVTSLPAAAGSTSAGSTSTGSGSSSSSGYGSDGSSDGGGFGY